MPEKNVQSAQWTKSAAQKVNYDAYGAVGAFAGSIPTTIYGGGATGLAVIPTQPIENLQDSYGNVRFPTPTLSSRRSIAPAPPSSTTLTTVLMPMGTTSTSVPGISGFVPPSYSALASTSARSAATSVLTPNPFALHNSNGGGASGSSNSTTFGLEQFQQLNAQQQFEFTKMMTAINTTAAVTPKASPTTASASVLNTASSSSNIPISSQQTTSGRQHTELSTTSGAITNSTAENLLNAISAMSSNVSVQGRVGVGVKLPDEDKMRRIQHVVESGIGDQAKQQILQILERISTLKPIEKLLLYLRLPGETPDTDPLRHPQNPLGTRSEINHTINWVRSHLEHDPQVSIPKQDVYNEYIAFCDRLVIKPLSTADFGKVMKQVFPEIRPRRLGTRGHSRYCYAAMRKTTKLNAPQLPQLGSSVQISKAMGVCEPTTKSIGGVECADSSSDLSDSSWLVIKIWAESVLNVKVENMKSLADHIQANSLITTALTGSTSALLSQKKGTQRESKEKRSTGDFGPLKKRQKKKRKGSSSSESSCNQPQQVKRIECSLIPSAGPPSADMPKEDDKDFTSQSVEIKQELMDSPIYQNVQNSVPPNVTVSNKKSVNLTDTSNQKHMAFGYNHLHQHNILIQQQLQQQKQQGMQQLLPMNLATETRTVLTRAPVSADGLTNFTGRVSNAVQNLTAKIMDLSSQTASVSSSSETLPVSVPSSVPISLPVLATTAVSELNTRVIDQTAIKEEVIDDYNPTNVFCKKVLKAQQTKGFWTNSPSSSTAVTITSSPISVITTTNTAPPLRTVEAEASHTSNYLMGPPAQISTSTSPSLSSSTASASIAPVSTLPPSTSIVPSAIPEGTSSTLIAQARVSSRNMMQLRAKKLRYYQMRENIMNNSSPGSDQQGGEGSTEIDKDTDLPENFGLPRERVISICNMDKHELDDYFLPGEEENSQDQEAELLQYFQMGDAEEKSNSLDDAKIISSPTALHLPPCTTNHKQNIVAGSVNDKRIPRGTQAYLNKLSTNSPHPETVVNDGVNIVTGVDDDMSLKHFRSVGDRVQSQAITPAVGSASASLALMSQKHQQQKQNKRKTNVGNTSLLDSINKSTTRKNCIFLPISPNINSSTPSATVSVAQGVTNGNVLFVSPGLTRLRLKPGALCKQLSLDFDATSDSDPMICASRRRKTTYSSPQIVQINTSASAPPSPSLLQQKQQATGMHQKQNRQSINDHWPLTNHVTSYNDFTQHNDASLLVDQNSLDLDLFNVNPAFEQDSIIDTTFSADCNVFTPLSETQRSQSVPLSQLQRIHSPAFNRNMQTNFSTCTSVAQTPVPSEFTDFSMFGDNGQSSVFSNQRSIKLETGNGLMVSESSTVLDEVDVSDILSSPDFVSTFSNAAHSSHAVTAATCSSAGSSSGYSSSTCTVFGGITANSILSRSVPSTPLPHQKQYPFGGGGGGTGGGGRSYSRQRTIDEIQLSPTETGIKSPAGTLTSTSAKYISSQLLSRTAYDISKSMPTTPITTPSFRYSPAEFHRDFLINGNTLESITSLPLPMNVLSGDSFMNGTMDTLNGDTLMVNGSIVTSDDFAVTGAVDADSTMVGSDLLDNL